MLFNFLESCASLPWRCEFCNDVVEGLASYGESYRNLSLSVSFSVQRQPRTAYHQRRLKYLRHESSDPTSDVSHDPIQD
jgi:hypothetical protein